MIRNNVRLSAAAAAAALTGVTASGWAAPISIGPGLTVSQDFNGLPDDNNPTAEPGAIGSLATSPFSATTGTQADIPGAPGFVATRVSGSSTGALPFVVNDGTNTTGGIQSLGVLNDSERALGVTASGTNVPAFGAEFVNNTGATLVGFNLTFNAEQYRSASGTTGVVNRVDFAFGTTDSLGPTTSSTFLTDADLIDVDSGDLVSTFSSTAVVTNNGTVPPTITTARNVGVTGLMVDPGESVFIRFTDFNDLSNDAVIGIDDLRFTAVVTPIPVPEPGGLAVLGVGGLLALRRGRRRA